MFIMIIFLPVSELFKKFSHSLAQLLCPLLKGGGSAEPGVCGLCTISGSANPRHADLRNFLIFSFFSRATPFQKGAFRESADFVLFHFAFFDFIIIYKNSGAPRKDVTAPIGRIAGDAAVREIMSAESMTAPPISAEHGIRNL